MRLFHSKSPGAAARTSPVAPAHVVPSQVAPAELHEPFLRYQILLRLLQHLEAGVMDPELLYLGGRYAASLGMERAACRFLDALSAILVSDDRKAPAFVPVGLLYLRVLTDREKRARILEDLEQLAAGSGDIARAVASARIDDAMPRPGSAAACLQQAIGSRRESTSHAAAAMAAEAKAAYREGRLRDARYALEHILLTDSDQPEALWNLLAVTAEQEDAEAYGRYWRRYVKLQLFRLMRSEDRWLAFEELLKFYRYACETCEQILKAAETKIGERLRMPGLLNRWLEAQLALIWLDGLVADPADVPAQPSTSARQVSGNAAVAMRFWFRAYYPEFMRYVSPGRPLEINLGGTPPPSRLVQDSAGLLVTRFAAWSRHGFGIDSDKDCPQAPALDAFAKAVATIEWAPYVKSAQQALRGEDTRIEPFRRRMMDAIGRPLLSPLHELRKQEDWQGIIEHYSDASVLAVLPPIARLLVGVAHCELKQFDAALDCAVGTLADLSTEDVSVEEKDGEKLSAAPRFYWRQIMLGVVGAAMQEPPTQQGPALRKIRDKLAKAPAATCTQDMVGELEQDIARLQHHAELDSMWDATMERFKQLVEKSDFAGARRVVEQLPDDDYIRKAKEQALDSIRGAERRAELDRRFDAAMASVKTMVEAKDYRGARRTIEQLPGDEYLREIKKSVLQQIREAEQDAKRFAAMDAQFEKAMASVQRAVDQGRIDEARWAIMMLPDDPYLSKAKANILSQLAEAERKSRRGWR